MADLAELKADVAEARESVQKLVDGFKGVRAANEEQKSLILELKAKIEAGEASAGDIDEIDAKVDEINQLIKDALPAGEAVTADAASEDVPALDPEAPVSGPDESSE